jgi:Protein of unknown function, DUF547
MIRWVAGLIALTVVAGCSSVPRTFSPPEPVSPPEFSHQMFDAVLRAHVANGVVNYPRIAADLRFESYLRLLDRVDPNSLPTHADRLAFWINAYNAFAIKGILDGYSPRTTFGQFRYFIAKEHRVGGATINLYDLERKLLIPDFQEPRIHFAIVCASMSCPKLHSWAYAADKLDELLELSAREFINDSSRNRFDRERKIAYLSMIFKWYEDDFTAHSGSLLNYVKRYVGDPNLARELESEPYRVEFLEYNWSLNGIPYAGPS